MGIRHFRIGTLLVLLSQILNFTTSDPRPDGQSSPFTIPSQKVHGMRNCRASIVAEIENPSLMEHRRLYPLSCLLFRVKKSHAGLFFYRHPIQNRPLEETNLFCLTKVEYQPNHRFAAVRILSYRCVCSTVHHAWVCHTRMMMLPAVAFAAGHGCSIVCIICIFTVLLLSTHAWVCDCGGGETQIHDRKYNMIKTVDAKVLNPNGPNIFVQNGDAAHNSSKRRSSITYTNSWSVF